MSSETPLPVLEGVISERHPVSSNKSLQTWDARTFFYLLLPVLTNIAPGINYFFLEYKAIYSSLDLTPASLSAIF